MGVWPMLYVYVNLGLFRNGRDAGKDFFSRAKRDGFVIGLQQLAEPLNGRLAEPFYHSPRSHLADG